MVNHEEQEPAYYEWDHGSNHSTPAGILVTARDVRVRGYDDDHMYANLGGFDGAQAAAQ
jgi:hypothetical protein